MILAQEEQRIVATNAAGKDLPSPFACGVRDLPIRDFDQDEKGLRVFDYARALEKFISLTDTPMTIGIQGDWGSGKTSLMNLIKNLLGAKVPTAWINTWKYSQAASGDALAHSVFLAIIKELKDIDKTGKARELLSTMGWALAGIAGKLAEKQIGLDIGSVFAKGDLDKVFERYEALEKLKDQLKALVAGVLENRASGMDRVVIFVDDLDRIDPIRAVEILEIIKIFLDIEGLVFILACDYEVVRRGLAAKGGLGESVSDRSFFDKIIQVPFRMPSHSSDKLENYMRGIFADIGISIRNEEVNTLITLLDSTTGSNPRTIKRLVNIVNLLLIILDSEKHAWDDLIANKAAIVFALVALQNAYPRIYAAIARESEDEVFDKWSPDMVAELGESEENENAHVIAENVNQVIQILQGLVGGRGHGGTLLQFIHVSDLASVQQKSRVEDKGTLTKPVKGYLNRLPETIRNLAYRVIGGLTQVRMSKEYDSIGIYPANNESLWVTIRKNRRCLDVVLPFDDEILEFVSREEIEERIRSLGIADPKVRKKYTFSELELADVLVIEIGEDRPQSEVDGVRDLLRWFLVEKGCPPEGPVRSPGE